MKGLLTALSVKRLPKKRWWHRQHYELLAPLMYATKAGMILVVPAGFITDFATWIKPRGKYEIAAVFHDMLYKILCGRRHSDKMFKEIMTRAGCSRARINMMYYGVRCLGWIPYYYRWLKSFIGGTYVK